MIANADGTLQAPARIDGVTKQGPVAAGDFNGDSRADLAVADTGLFFSDTANSVRVYHGNANGTFTAATTLTPATHYQSLGAGDMNEDGRADLVIGANDLALDARVFVLTGQSGGTFGAPSTFAIRNGFSEVLASLAVADITTDGHADVITGRDHLAIVLGGAGDGTLLGEGALTIAPQIGYIQAADLDQDGAPDAVAAIDQLGIVPLIRTDQAIPEDAGAPPPPPAPDFSMSASNSTLAAAAGQSAQTAITVTPQNGFSGQVNFSCSGLPRSATCAFAPTSVTPSGSAASTTLTIATDGGAVASLAIPAAPYAFAALALFAAGIVTPRERRARVAYTLLATVVLGTVVS